MPFFTNKVESKKEMGVSAPSPLLQPIVNLVPGEDEPAELAHGHGLPAASLDINLLQQQNGGY